MQHFYTLIQVFKLFAVFIVSFPRLPAKNGHKQSLPCFQSTYILPPRVRVRKNMHGFLRAINESTIKYRCSSSIFLIFFHKEFYLIIIIIFLREKITIL